MSHTNDKLAVSMGAHYISNVFSLLSHLSWEAKSNRTAHSASNSNFCCFGLADASVGNADVGSPDDEKAGSICSP